MSYPVVLIPGDGVGPEVTEAARQIVDATGVSIEWKTHYAGGEAVERFGSPLPEETLSAISEAGTALKGPLATASGTGFRSVNVEIRKRLDLYANFRPARSMAGIRSRYADVDLIVIRENTEGLYSGLEHEVVPGVVESLRIVTKRASERIARFAFETARKYGREKVTCVHKANILKLSDGLFLECARDEHKRGFTQIEYEERIIDAACMQLVQDPGQFDVLLCENLYGDVISDLCAGMVGGLGVTPGANFGDRRAIFEAVHGTAPDIMGKNLANPLALLMSAVMMLNYLAANREDPACAEIANRLKDAYNGCLDAGEKTRDLGGTLSCSRFTEAVIARL